MSCGFHREQAAHAHAGDADLFGVNAIEREAEVDDGAHDVVPVAAELEALQAQGRPLAGTVVDEAVNAALQRAAVNLDGVFRERVPTGGDDEQRCLAPRHWGAEEVAGKGGVLIGDCHDLALEVRQLEIFRETLLIQI